jgi:hypothetical protein
MRILINYFQVPSEGTAIHDAQNRLTTTLGVGKRIHLLQS